MPLELNAEELMDFFDEVFPQINGEFSVDRLEEMELDLRLNVGEQHLRPGGTVSGPAMFTLADCAAYGVILSMIGRKALAVTTSCSLDFMRKPAAATDLIAKCRLLKLGKALAVTEMLIYSDGVDKPVARANMTYSIPPN